MIRLFSRISVITLLSFLIGSGVALFTHLETSLGLETLFTLRGIRPAPQELVIIAMDEASEAQLNVGQDLTRWRSFHAKLINELQQQQVALIIFDLQFIAAQPQYDPAFAKAMHAAANVLIAECVQKLRRGNEDFYGREECSESHKDLFVTKTGKQGALSEQVVTQRQIVPNTMLADAALDHAPFYITHDADQASIRAAWTFYYTLAETPSLPVLAWFYYLHNQAALPESLSPQMPYSSWLSEQRKDCSADASLGSHINLTSSETEAFISRIICLEDSHYLDFYGPPQTISMASYADVYQGKVKDLAGKVVFIGKANRQYSPGKLDFFQTPFTNTKSGEMSGVEIMATQFANLLERRLIVSPVAPGLLLFTFSLVIALILTRFSGLSGIVYSLGFALIYAGVALWLFSRFAFWLPIAVPILIQLPLAITWSLIMSRRDLLAERTRIISFVRQVFPQWAYFLPSAPGQWDPGDYNSQRDVKGLCLATDVEDYTALAAQYTPHQMWALLNDYYQILGHSVLTQQGLIADITGDAMMAVWIDLPDQALRQAACLAALDMQRAIANFNDHSTLGRLPTRIGLHEGDLTLGSLGTRTVSHYRAIGETVNTASRIQGVNKYLKTKILASSSIVNDLTEFVCRPMGAFLLKGSQEPITLFELVGLATEISHSKQQLHAQFASALSLFQHGQWQAAAQHFQALLQQHTEDGPSQFYLELARQFQQNPPKDWQGFLTLEGK